MRIKVSPLVLAVALGLLNPAALDGAPDGAPSQRGRVKQERPSGGDAESRADDDGSVVDAGDRG
jgi:hypothetical protein